MKRVIMLGCSHDPDNRTIPNAAAGDAEGGRSRIKPFQRGSFHLLRRTARRRDKHATLYFVGSLSPQVRRFGRKWAQHCDGSPLRTAERML
jgi:hypothetical protein